MQPRHRADRDKDAVTSLGLGDVDGNFIIKISAESIADLKGPIEGIIEYFDRNDRHRSEIFDNSVEVIASTKNAFTPKVRFKSFTVNGKIVRGI